MPEVPQQIFGASVDTVTATSAVLTWSTTVADATSVQFAVEGETPGETDDRLWTAAGTDHAVTLTGLEVNTTYVAHIGANETQTVLVTFTTGTVVDETPPDVLNLAAEVLEDGRVTVTWYTSESATETVYLNEQSVHEDGFATKKNHVFTTDVLPDGTYDLEVVSADASGNSNSSRLTFTVSVGATVDDPTNDDDVPVDDGQDETSSTSSTSVQLVALVVILLVLLAFLRVRNGPNDDDPWQ
jgi:hypothetical protein